MQREKNGMSLGCSIRQDIGQISSGVDREWKGIDRKEEVEEKSNGKRKRKRIKEERRHAYLDPDEPSILPDCPSPGLGQGCMGCTIPINSNSRGQEGSRGRLF